MSIEMVDTSTMGEFVNKSKTECVEKPNPAIDDRPEIDLLRIIAILHKQQEERL